MLVKSRKLYDEEYCFKTRMNKHSNKGAQIYGTEKALHKEPAELRNLKDYKEKNKIHSFVSILRFIRLSSLTSSLVYFAILKEDSGSPSSNLSVVIFLAAFTLLCEWFIEFISSVYSLRNTQYSRRLYLFGLISLTSSLILSFVSFKTFYRIISILVISLFSLGSFSILLYYLYIGWLFSSKVTELLGVNISWGSFVFRTIALCGTGLCSIIFVGFKIYGFLPSLEPIDFWHPSWSIICIFLVIAHSIIFIYEFLLKESYSPQDFYSQFKKDYVYEPKIDRYLCTYVFYSFLYLALEVLIALKLDGYLPEGWDWRLILMPLYLLVLSDLLRMVYVGKKVIEFFIGSKNIPVERPS
jgi:hypothetical protein